MAFTAVKQMVAGIFTGFLVIVSAQASPVVKHDIKLKLQPSKHHLYADDLIRIDGLGTSTALSVSLNAQLKLSSNDKNVVAIEIIKPTTPATPDEVAVKKYRIRFRSAPTQFQLQYSGHLQAAQQQDDQESNAAISPRYVTLSAEEHWYPTFYDGELVQFSLRVDLPKAWHSVSQGNRIENKSLKNGESETWLENNAQTTIYLIAAPFVEYEKKDELFSASVYLRQADAELAQKYLDASLDYLHFYQDLLGKYPYTKFATVENTWDSGYGMPSFTLLGSKILRFPFILTSSFPHEILHNWWGNSVYVDYSNGNWSEGLTEYLADHLFKEQKGEAQQFRLDMLQKYHDFVGEQKDFSIANFQSRFDERSQSVGYDKTAMMFHMLRLQLGDRRFINALRHVYKQQQFKITTFKDLEQRLSENSESDLSNFFSQWVDRIGAPDIKVEHIEARQSGDNYVLSLALHQRQNDEPYQLLVPIWIWFDGDKPPQQEMLNFTQRQQIFQLNFREKPIRVDIDPQFDVFRRLDSGEIPAALSQGLGAEATLMILPKQAEKSVYAAYNQLALQWKTRQPNATIVADDQLDHLPDDATIWLLGWENRFRHHISNSETGMRINTWPDKMRLGDTRVVKGKSAVVIAGRRQSNRDHSLLWLAADKPATIEALARKLPHYKVFSYLVFNEGDANNQLKGKWLLQTTPMKFYLQAPRAHYADIPPRVPLATLANSARRN